MESDETKLPVGPLTKTSLEYFHENVYNAAANSGVEWNDFSLNEEKIGFADREAPDVKTLEPHYKDWERDDALVNFLLAVEKII